MPILRTDPLPPPPHFRVEGPGPDLSIVVPIFEEEEVLPLLIERLTEALDRLKLSSEVILVDDGSQDGTAEIAAKAHCDDPRFRALCLSRNFGHQAAISAGLAEARGGAVLVMDGDLQDPPEAIGRLWQKLGEGYDVVYAIRVSRPEGRLKRLAYAAFYRLLQCSVSIPMPLDAGDFGIMTRRVVDVLNELPERRRFVRGLRAWAGFRQVGVPIEREPRAGGVPKYSWGKLISLAIDGLVGFSETPLRWAGSIGIASVALAFLVAILVGFGFAPTATGWPWILSVVLFLGGVQLFSIALLGEYVSRTLQETRARPAYIVRRRIGFEPVEDLRQSRPLPTRRVRHRG